MGWLQTMGKRVALRVSALVARNELFERYGERPVQPPLEPGRWAGSSEDVEASPEDGSSDDDDDESSCTISDLDGVRSLLAGGPKVVHHWATWCESCIQEMDLVRQLAREASLPMIGLSWDAFEAENAEACVSDVREVASEHGLQFPQYVLDAQPDDFFAEMNMPFKQVPQTWLVDGAGAVVHRVEGVLDASTLSVLKEQAESLA